MDETPLWLDNTVQTVSYKVLYSCYNSYNRNITPYNWQFVQCKPGETTVTHTGEQSVILLAMTKGVSQ